MIDLLSALGDIAREVVTSAGVDANVQVEGGEIGRVSLSASTADAAPLVIETDGERVVWVHFGRDSTIELEVANRAWERRVRALVDGVLRGEVTETLWLRGDQVLRSEAVIGTGPDRERTQHFSSRSKEVEDRRVVTTFRPYA